MTARAREDSALSRIVSTVASSLDLQEVLAAIVRLLSEASAVHACFVYLLDEPGDRLVLRAASEPYDHLVDQIELAKGEGLAWWAIEHREPAFIPDDLLGDPRVKYVPELEEERFQSLLSVPIVGKHGDAIGVISAHTVAPREFAQDEVDFVVTASSLVAGAIENARHYAEMRRRVEELEALTRLSEAIARSETLEELLPEVAEGGRALLSARSCHVYLIEPGGDELALRESSPAGAEARERIALAELGPELSTRSRRGRISVPLVADDELLGLMVAGDTRRLELARALAGQVSVGIKKVRLIERLTERNLVKDFFEELARGGAGPALEGRAARVGFDLMQPHVVLAAQPVDDGLEGAIAGVGSGALVARRGDTTFALLPVGRAGVAPVAAAVRRIVAEHGHASVGISGISADPAAYPDAFEEARHALVGTAVLRRDPPLLCYDELGAYKVILRIAAEGGIRDSTVDAVARLAEYDAQRQAQLLSTLEEFLRRHGSITATSEALYVHPNTLRQRLRRIAEIAEIDLRRDDWLMIEIATKLVRLRSDRPSQT